MMKLFNILLVATMMIGCGGQDSKTPIENSVSLDKPLIELNDESMQWITIESSESWEVTLQFEQGIDDWATLGTNTSGSGNDLIKLSYQKNMGSVERSVVIVVDFESGQKRVTLTQKYNEESIYEPPKWIELPAINEDEENVYITHSMNFNGKEQRNYSMLYNTSGMVGLWIAYPMHRDYNKSSGGFRSQSYYYDPSIPSYQQPDLSKSYVANGNPYQRGHMLPSADRNVAKDMNDQVFYCTNIAPQIGKFNTGRWGKLESHIRTMVNDNAPDTMWIALGAVFRTVGGSEAVDSLVNQNNGVKNAVPNYFYKVAIMYDNGTYKGVGFWFEHFNESEYSGAFGNNARTIDEIEVLTGFDFFANLSEAEQIAAEGSIDRNFWGI